MGMKLWFVPQISLHCPYNIPARLIVVLNSFNLPGQASTFINNAGTEKLCITSVEVTKNRINLFVGKTSLEEQLSNLKCPSFSVFDSEVRITDSTLNSLFDRFLKFRKWYEYIQYH